MDDLIKMLRACQNDHCICDNCVEGTSVKSWRRLMGMAADALEARAPRWISVDDIVPDKDSEVLVCDKNGAIGVGYYTGTWYSCNTPYRITHWMPLPKAPEDE